jgi:hypothetical protein
MTTKIKENSATQYLCECCDYITSKKCNYDQHILTRKHIMTTAGLQNQSASIVCDCGKSFSCRQNIYRHKKKCSMITPSSEISAHPSPIPHTYSPTEDMQMTLILELVKQNQEFKNLLIQQSNQMMEQNKTMMDVAKNSQVSNSHNTLSHNNNNNKTFNLQFFLNETCKDAMNMKDFIQSLEMSLPELEKMGEVGFAEGMSRVFVNRLNSLDVTKRPIHCSDVKREIIHIKDDNKWERDNANLDRLRKIIKQLTHKNILRVDDWKKANPGCTEYNSRKNDQYLKLNIEAIGPVDDADVKKDFGKIIRRVAESTTIDKKYL